MALVSVFKNTFEPFITIPNAPEGKEKIQHPYSNIELHNVIVAIGSGVYEEKINDWLSGKIDKKSLPCFTPCGRFRLRLDNELIEYSSIVVLDYDKLTEPTELKNATREIPYTLAAFISPSKKGVKVFVKHGFASGQHKVAFDKISAFYDDYLGVKSDRSGSNLSRLCYFGSDKNMFYNPNCDTFKIEQNYTRPIEGNYTSFADWITDFTAAKVGGYYPNNRHNFIYTLACNCNRYGIPQDKAAEICYSFWSTNTENFSEAEFVRHVANGYKNTAEHGKFKIPYHKLK